jgi:hypothetical protein
LTGDVVAHQASATCGSEVEQMTPHLKHAMLNVTIASFATVAAIAMAKAAPPTAQYSPGYEARLAEARKAAQLRAQHELVVTLPIRKRYHHRRVD